MVATRGVLIYLETLEARDVPFYASCGLRVIARGDLPGSDVHVWAMRTP